MSKGNRSKLYPNQKEFLCRPDWDAIAITWSTIVGLLPVNRGGQGPFKRRACSGP